VDAKPMNDRGDAAVDASRGSASQGRRAETSFPIVGIGASAGGLEALEIFLRNVPENSGMAFVIVQHLDPTHKGTLIALLQRTTKMLVAQASDSQRVEPNHVYVIPPGKDMAILRGSLQILPQVSPRGLGLPIDFFFRSLAEDQRERSIGVVLSGMGSDGMLGMRAIKESGGAAFVQSLESAKFDGMPRSVIDAGLADVVAPAEKLPNKISGYSRHATHLTRPEEPIEERAKNALEKVYLLLRSHTGNDFSLYKKSTIHRRIERRMGLHQIDNITNYVRYLREHPREIEVLFRELLIGVTSFFRDPAAWEYLRDEALPKLLIACPSGATIRAWVPGCSTGEEAYSLAIAFKEALESLKVAKNVSLQVFATDLDKDAIEKARQGVYPTNIVADVSPERLRRFFIQEERGYRVSKEIRELVVFAPQNIIMDPPFTKLDILSCRNLLIYLAPELQKKIIPLFHYSLNQGGLLFLGSAETVGTFTGLFAALDGKTRVYRRLEGGVGAVAVNFPAAFAHKPIAPQEGQDESNTPFSWPPSNLQTLADHVLMERFAPAAVLASEKGEILYISGRTGKYLEPAAGKASMNLFAMTRDGLRLELASAFSTALREDRPVIVRGIRVGTNGGTQVVDLTVQQLNEPRELRGMVMVVLADVSETDASKPSRRSSVSHRSLRLEQELQRAHDEILTTREEMQTSQEELKSTNEELQSTNEELQSTNEELTTSREEMQSMNEELQTVNHELQSKVDELSRTNNDMKNLLNSTDIATLFLDGQLLVRRFTTRTANIIRLIPSDAGRPISDIARDIDYPELADDARDVLRTLVFKERLVSGSQNRWFTVRIMPYRTLENVIDGVVITFTDASATQTVEADLRHQAKELRQMVNALRQLAWACKGDGACDYVSPQWLEYTGATAAELHGFGWLHTVHVDEREAIRDRWRALVRAAQAAEFEIRLRDRNGNYRWFRLHSTPVRDPDGTVVRWYGSCVDIHDLKLAAEHNKRATDRLASVLENASEPFLTVTDDETVASANRAALRMMGSDRVAGKRLDELWPESTTLAFRESLRRAARDGGESSFEAQLETGGDAKFNVRVFPSTEGIALFFHRDTGGDGAGSGHR